MGIRKTTDRILDDLDQVCATHDLDGRAIGLAMWGLRLGEAPEAPFDEPGEARDALVRFMWLLLVRHPAQQRTGFVTSLMRLEMLMGGLESLAQIDEDLREFARLGGDLVEDQRLPASWSHSANALRDVLRRTGDELLLLVLRPMRDMQPDTDAPRVAALEAHTDDRLRRYLDTGHPMHTVPPQAGRDRAEYGLHLAWWGEVDAGLAAIATSKDEGVPAWIAARMRASTLFRAGRFAEAVPAYETALELRPAADTAYDLGLCLANLGRDEEADAAYGRAAELDPSWPDPLWNRGRLRMERLGDAEGARRDTEAAIALDPHNADLRYNLAVVDRMTGDLETAVNHLGEALRLAPDDPKILGERAHLRQRLGHADGALSDARRVLEQQADNAAARVVEAQALRDLGRLEASAAAWNRALPLLRGPAPGLFAEAAAVDAELGRRERAISRFREALRQAPEGSPAIAQATAGLEALGYTGSRTWPLRELSDHGAMEASRQADPELHASLSAVIGKVEVLQHHGQFAEAGRALEAWLDEHDAPEAWLSLGLVRRNLGDIPGAFEAIDHAIAVDPSRVLPRAGRAELLGLLHRFDEAEQAWSNVLATHPEVVEVWHQRGFCRENLGRLDEALADYERALALDPGHLDALYNRAIVLGDLGRLDDALAAYDHLLVVAPDDVQGRLNRATLRMQVDIRDQTEDLSGALADLDYLVAHRPGLGKAWAKRGATRLFAGDVRGALLDSLVGFELLEPDQPQKSASADMIREALALFDPATHGLPSRTALHRAARTLVDHLPYGAEDSVHAFFDDLEGPLGHAAMFWAVRAETGRALALPEARCEAWRRRALQCDMAYPYARFLHADALIRQDPTDDQARQAKRLLTDALADSDPTLDADWRLLAHLRLGRLHLDDAEYPAATRVLEAGLALDERSEEQARTAAHIAFLLGYVRSMGGDAEGALAAYTRGIALDPSKPNLWFNRACEHARLCGDDDKHRDLALADLAEAMERDRTAGRRAEQDVYFEPLWTDPAFRALVTVRPADRRAG